MRRTKTTQEFITESMVIHGDRYKYDKSVYNGANIFIKVICPLHGEFSILPSNHIRKKHPYGCSQCGKCSLIKRNISGKKIAIEYEEKAKIIHLNKYEYFGDYSGSNKRIRVCCTKHGDFFPIASNHDRGTGCPRCKNSKGCFKIENILKDKRISFIKEHAFSDCRGDFLPLRFDFFIPSHNIAIEYDGQQHFKPTKFHNRMTETQINEMFDKVIKYDKIKELYCQQKNISLIRISYKTIKNADGMIHRIMPFSR